MAPEDNPADNAPFDPLTSPAWMFEDDEDILLAPPVAEFFTDIRTAHANGPSAPPPKIDEIISGGYTGWVPIIRAGESLAQAEDRAAHLAQSADVIEADQTAAIAQEVVVDIEPRTTAGTAATAHVVVEEIFEVVGSVPIVPDPDEVASPSQALDEARKRIAAMRASLQLNLNQVAESFTHPIFTPAQVSAQQAQATSQPEESESVEQQPTVQSFTTPLAAPTAQAQPETAQEADYVQPEPTRIFTPTETQTQPEAEVRSANQDHSLELIIMRDEIRDLRDRLDASQKLIEELMHRLANLAELALRR